MFMTIEENGILRYNMAMQPVSLLPKSGPKLPMRRRSESSDWPPFAYAAGILGVGLALVFLPLAYLGTVGVTLWLLYFHLTRDSRWIFGPEAGLPMACLYLASALVLVLLGFFLLRPLIPDRRRPKADLELSPEQEPRLHAFVQQICAALGSPAPMRILVNMDVNASARFVPGFTDFWQGRLELVLGLPLVRGLDLGQFAGVLAHELGHFRQGAGMRMVHGIRAVNQWFLNAAAHEDAWEKDLSQKGHKVDPFLFLPGWCAMGCAWVVRKILRAHVRAGQAVSCVLLRQMEHEADRAAIRLVGGETFAGMVLEAKVLEAAWGLANRSLGMALREGRLADDLPGLVSAHTRVFIPEVRRKMERSLLREKTALFDTHPSLAERIKRARHSASRGMFRANGQAHSLFFDFASLSRRATMAFYRQDLGDDFNPSRMISTSDLVTGQSEIQVGEAAVSGYFLGLLTNLRPIWIVPSDLRAPADFAELRDRLKQARACLERGSPRASDLYRAFSAADAKMLDAVQALALMRANFWIEPTDFQLRRGGTGQAGTAFKEAEAEQRSIGVGLVEFEQAMRVRLISALGLLGDPEVRSRLQDAYASSREVTRLLPSLEGLSKVLPRLDSLRRSLHGMGILLENLEGNESATELLGQLKTHSLAIRIDLEAVGAGLAGLEYPFGLHSSGSGLAGYALDAMPSEQDFHGHYIAAEEALGRCYAFYFRILGRLALAAGRVEGVLGLGPLQIGGPG